MNEQTDLWISELVDGELAGSDVDTALHRLKADAGSLGRLDRFALIGETMRGGLSGSAALGVADRVMAALAEAEAQAPAASDNVAQLPTRGARSAQPNGWTGPLASMALAAGVALVALTLYYVDLDSTGVGIGVDSRTTVRANDGADFAAGQTARSEQRVSASPTAAGPSGGLWFAGYGDVVPSELTTYVFDHAEYSYPNGTGPSLAPTVETDVVEDR